MPRPPPADTAAASSVVPTPPSTASWKGSRQPTRWVKRVSTIRTLGAKAARRVGNSDPGDVDGGVEAGPAGSRLKDLAPPVLNYSCPAAELAGRLHCQRAIWQLPRPRLRSCETSSA